MRNWESIGSTSWCTRIDRHYVIALLMVLVVLAGAEDLRGQRKKGIPHVISMESGLLFDGTHFSTPAVSESLPEIMEYGTRNIIVVDEGLRWVFVNLDRIRNTAPSARVETDYQIWQRVHPTSMRGAGVQRGATAFNDLGHRLLKVKDSSGRPFSYVQGITKINPRYVVVDTLTGSSSPPRSFNMAIGRSTVSPDVIRSLLRSQITKPDSPQEHREIVDFFVQAQLYDQANDELRLLQQQFPDLREDFDEDRRKVRQQFASQVIREIRFQIEAGQTTLARKWAESFNREGVAGQTLAELQSLIDDIDAQQAKVATARSAVMELISEIEQDQALNLDPIQKTAMQRFKDDLETELSHSNVSRLDSFLLQANDQSQTSLQKVALAMSGWLRGSNNAIDNFAVVQSMFQIRDLIIEFMNTKEPIDRARIINQIVKFEAGAPDFIADMVAQMKPFGHQKEWNNYPGKEPIEFFVEVDGTKARPERRKVRCLVHLPAEYDPYESYPLLISLPDRASIDEQIQFFTGKYLGGELNVRYGAASKAGTIVMAVDWRLPGQETNGYSAREHQTVLRALRAAFDKFAVNTDKVFLQGYGIGANVAYDVGLSHPEHWAGVIGISGEIQRYSLINSDAKGVPLAIYSVVGEKDYHSIRACKDAWNKWLGSKNSYDCTLSMYVGRLNESFFDDIPNMFKWMRAQKRRLPDRNGFEFEAKSMRPWENYFWFFELHGFPLKNISWPEDWKPRGHKPLKFKGKIKPSQPGQPGSPTKFILGPSNAGSGATLWLAPEYFNFDNPIEISGRGGEKGDVKPSTAVILNDVRVRGDRQHPFWARIDSVGSKWTIRE